MTSSRSRETSSSSGVFDMPAEPNSVSSLKAYYKDGGRSIDGLEFARTLYRESDRAFVIIYAASLEDALAAMIRSRLRQLDAKAENELRLFTPDGILGSFSAKIAMAYAMEIIDNDTRAKLGDIREMRNACAHSIRDIDFSTPQLANVCKRILRPSFQPPAADELAQAQPHATPEERLGVALRVGFQLEVIALTFTILGGSEAAERFFRDEAENLRSETLAQLSQPSPDK